MLETDVAYLAGLFDGEGCIYIGSNSSIYQPQISITNTNLGVLEWVQDQFGGNIRQHKIQKKHHKQCYEIRWTSSKARSFLVALIPYLRIKRLQAELTIELIDLIVKRRKIDAYTSKELSCMEDIVYGIQVNKHA